MTEQILNKLLQQAYNHHSHAGIQGISVCQFITDIECLMEFMGKCTSILQCIVWYLLL